jgi:hypothetical protein
MKSVIAKENLILMQFIPILLILIYSSHRYTFSSLSHSVLGKFFAVMLILYYTRMHFLYGTVACFVVIIYYMLTEVEGFSEETPSSLEKASATVEATPTVAVDDKLLVADKPETTSIITIDEFNKAKDEFIKEKCKNGVLMYKDLPVKTEMADHIYSEIKFNKSVKCNPCDRTCDYNIVEAKMKTQEALTPKSSRNVKI